MKSWCWDSHERKKMQDRESYIRNLWRPRQLELTSSRQLFPKKMWSLTRLLVILCEKAICHFLNQLHVASFPAAIWTFWVLNFMSDLSFNVFAWGPQTLPPPAPSLLAPQGPWGDPRGLKRNVLKQQCSHTYFTYYTCIHYILKPFFPWNRSPSRTPAWDNSFNLKNEHNKSVEKNRNKNSNIFYCILCILSIQICKC